MTGRKPTEAEVDNMIDTGESETIFQKAILEQGRGHVSSLLALLQATLCITCIACILLPPLPFALCHWASIELYSTGVTPGKIAHILPSGACMPCAILEVLGFYCVIGSWDIM